MVVLYSFAAIVTLSTLSVRYKMVPWILCITFIARATQVVPFSSGTHIFYREFNIYLYGSIKILNFCLHLCDNPKEKNLLIPSLLYYAYLPYSMTLIVTFENFMTQFQKWETKKDINWANLKSALFFGSRLIFWFYFFELLLHVIHVNAIFNSPFSIVNSLNVYEGNI